MDHSVPVNGRRPGLKIIDFNDTSAHAEQLLDAHRLTLGQAEIDYTSVQEEGGTA